MSYWGTQAPEFPAQMVLSSLIRPMCLPNAGHAARVRLTPLPPAYKWSKAGIGRGVRTKLGHAAGGPQVQAQGSLLCGRELKVGSKGGQAESWGFPEPHILVQDS